MKNVFLITNEPFIKCGMIPFITHHFIQQHLLSAHGTTRILEKNLSVAIFSTKILIKPTHDPQIIKISAILPLFFSINQNVSFLILYLQLLFIHKVSSNHFPTLTGERNIHYILSDHRHPLKTFARTKFLRRMIQLSSAIYFAAESSKNIKWN